MAKGPNNVRLRVVSGVPGMFSPPSANFQMTTRTLRRMMWTQRHLLRLLACDHAVRTE